jgi:hypothetical protein
MPDPDNELPEPHTWWGDDFNAGVNTVTQAAGYSSQRVPDDDDNPFYRDNAQYMPGWQNTFGISGVDPHGEPSGATAQDRATNYVGQNDPTGVWHDVRGRIVDAESSDIDQLPKGPDGAPQGNLGFGQVYQAHVDAYQGAQSDAHASGADPGANNPFIDPASFAIASYGAPLLENAGIDSGPATGASIDFFNDPTDSATAGWTKRTGLAAAESAVPVVGPPLAAFSEAYNTASAVQNGMPGEVEGAIEHTASNAANAVGNATSWVGNHLPFGH